MSRRGRAEVRGGPDPAGSAPASGPRPGAWPGRRRPAPHTPRGASFRPARPGRDLAGTRRSRPGGGTRTPLAGRAALCPRRRPPESRFPLPTPARGPSARCPSCFGPAWRPPGRNLTPEPGSQALPQPGRRDRNSSFTPARAPGVERAAKALPSQGLCSRARGRRVNQ